MSRIAIRDGRFVDTGTGRPFQPLEANYYRLGPNGIVTEPGSAEINPAYLANLIRFLRALHAPHLFPQYGEALKLARKAHAKTP